LEDSIDRMVFTEYNLKIAFYSAKQAKEPGESSFIEAYQGEKNLKDYENVSLKQILDINTRESDKRLKLPIYKYKRRLDK